MENMKNVVADGKSAHLQHSGQNRVPIAEQLYSGD